MRKKENGVYGSNEYMHKMDMRRIRKLLPEKIDTELGEDLYIVRINYDESYAQKLQSFLEYPCRTDVYFAFFCNTGSLHLEVNLREVNLTEHTMFISTPGNIVKIKVSQGEKAFGNEMVLLAISPSFLSNLSFELTKSLGDMVSFFFDPVIHLEKDEINMCSHYLNLSKFLVDSDCSNKREALSALVSSLFYYFVGFLTDQGKRRNTPPLKNGSMKATMVLERFIKLVMEYHNSERNMAFYADNIGLTPKYLSKIVKQASGRSAPDWIDSFVILEAKNMLKYTDISIKEIVYRLHFPNPSVFYKFFKSHTGMTPNEYRNM